MRIIELILDEENIEAGVGAMSIVENPAIESEFIALSKQNIEISNDKIELAEVSKERKVLMGAALIPNKTIFRKNEKEEYYVYFSSDTVRKASEYFLMNGNQNKATLEHEVKLNGLGIVESWIVEDEVKDKSRMFGLNVPVGTWMVSMKVHSDEVWQYYIKSGKVKGFSIEGYFADKVEMAKIEDNSELKTILADAFKK